MLQSPPPNLHTILARLYDQPGDVRRIAAEAGITRDRIPQESKMINHWHELLQEAQNQGKLDALLAVVATEYPKNQELTVAIATYRHAAMPLSTMHLLNFAHPITPEQQQQIEEILGKRLDLSLAKTIETKFKDTQPYGPQCEILANQVGFTSSEWQSLPLLINPPGFVPGALALISELHGRMRHFPTVIRMRPVTLEGTRSFAVAEILNLQEIRDRARNRS